MVKNNLINWLNWLSKTGVLLVILTTLFFFWNITTNYFDTPKLLILIVFCGLFLVLTLVNFIVEGRFTLLRTPFDLPFLIILIAAVVSTFLSSSQTIAIYGLNTNLHGSLIAIVIYTFLYFLLVNHLKKAVDVSHIVYLLIFSGVFLSILSLLNYAGVKWLPLNWASGTNFSPTGSPFSTAALLTLILPVIILRVLNERDLSKKSIFAVLLGLFALTILLIGSLPVYIAAGLALAIVLITSNKKTLGFCAPFLAGPLIIAGIVFAFSLIPPVGANKNPLYTLSQNFQREVQLSFPISWKVAISAFRDSPIYGSGPATTMFNFTAYKPIEFNSTPYWNLRFDTLFNEYLGVLSTLGGIGLVGLLLLTTVFISLAIQTISRTKVEDHLSELKVGVAVSGLAFFTLLALHPSTLPLWVLGIVLISSFLVLNREFIQNVSVKTEVPSSNLKLNLDALPVILMLIILILIGAGFVFIGRFALADYHHQLGVKALSQNQGIIGYNELVTAEKIDPKVALYHTDLAQTSFVLANAIASSKGPTESSPSGSLTDADKQMIQQLLSQAIAEGQNATTLSPKNPAAWEILGSIYRQISGVAQNALSFALDSYGKAVGLDPLNPVLRLNIGGVYYSVKNYEMAIRFFTDAITLKPDYANAYYNLSVTLRDKGDLPNAQAVAEKMISLLDPKSPDYKTASDFLSDLKARIATGSADQAQMTPPAASESGALQKSQLPKVLNLPKPENISTPPAIKKKLE